MPTFLTAEGLARLLQRVKTVFATKTEVTTAVQSADSGCVHLTGSETIAGTKTFSSTISGNAATADEFSASKAVTLTGAVTGTASSTAGWTVQTRLKTFRGCLESEANDACYFKIAYGSITGTYNHHDLVILVQNIVSGYGSGFWNIHLYSGATAGVLNAGLSRLTSSVGLNKDRFILVYKNNSGGSLSYELWTHLPDRYSGYRFTVISEASRSGKTVADLLTVIDADTGGGSTALPSDYTAVSTTYGTVSGDISGNSANVSGTVAIANGGTGATTRLNAIKALTNENVGTNATHVLCLKSDWSKVGYMSLSELKTNLSLPSLSISTSGSGNAVTAISVSGHAITATKGSTFLTSHQSLSNYLQLSGGNLTGRCKITGNNFGWQVTNGTETIEFMIGSGKVNRGFWDTKLNKWAVYANDSEVILNGRATGTSSDRRIKQDFSQIPDAVLDAWDSVQWKQFRLRREAAKSETAPIHAGAVAQNIQECLQTAGIDPEAYALTYHEPVPAEEGDRPSEDNPEITNGEKWYLRYEEAYAIEAAYLRRRCQKLEERIAALEAKGE